ncbi:MAG: type II secretion system protein [Candidatus Omnitrophota bacterium]
MRKMLGKRGFTLVEIMMVIAIVAGLAVVAIPNYIRIRRIAHQNACIHNLKAMDEAKDMWALMEGKVSADTPSWGDLITEYIKKTPSCPDGGTYSINRVDEYPTCTTTDHELI